MINSLYRAIISICPKVHRLWTTKGVCYMFRCLYRRLGAIVSRPVKISQRDYARAGKA